MTRAVCSNNDRVNPVALSDLLPTRTDSDLSTGFVTGAFVTGFDPREFETKFTVLNPGIRVQFEGGPDISRCKILYGQKVESSPVLILQNREICKGEGPA